MLLHELLARQRRTEIRVALSHEIQGSLTNGLSQLPVTRTSALARNKPGRSVRAKGTAQSLNLAEAQAQALGRLSLRQPTFGHTADDLQPLEFFRTHRQVSRVLHVGLQDREGARNPTFLLCRNPTFALCAYTANVR